MGAPGGGGAATVGAAIAARARCAGAPSGDTGASLIRSRRRHGPFAVPWAPSAVPPRTPRLLPAPKPPRDVRRIPIPAGPLLAGPLFTGATRGGVPRATDLSISLRGLAVRAAPLDLRPTHSHPEAPR